MITAGLLTAGSDVLGLGRDGARLWSFPTGNAVRSSPAVANGVVYVGSFDADLYAFDLAGGTAAIQRPTTRQLHPDYTLRPRNSPGP